MAVTRTRLGLTDICWCGTPVAIHIQQAEAIEAGHIARPKPRREKPPTPKFPPEDE